jgi:hypothetical protein
MDLRGIRMMEIIKGDKLPLSLEKIADLLYFDGPFASLFEDKEEKVYYIYWWCDVDQKCNRWLIFKVNHKQIKDYIDGTISMREIVLKTKSFFLCDINNDVEYENVCFIPYSQLPESYIPGKKSFFDSELAGITEEDLSILNKRFMSDSPETKSNILNFRRPIKNTIPNNAFYNQSFNKEIRNAA